MFKKLSLAGAAIAMTATMLVPATPAAAQRYGGGYSGYDRGYDGDRGYDNGRGYDNQRGYDGYRERGGYNGYNGYSGYRNDDRRYYRNRTHNYRCSDGTGGTIIGAIAGGLLGNAIAGRGDRTLGTVLGAGGGALAGRAIDRSGRRC